jgi:hypothetical protein
MTAKPEPMGWQAAQQQMRADWCTGSCRKSYGGTCWAEEANQAGLSVHTGSTP